MPVRSPLDRRSPHLAALDALHSAVRALGGPLQAAGCLHCAAMELRPLSQGNRLQRAYARWAARRYERMPAEAREQAELIDRFLYSRGGLGFWLGLLGSVAGTTAGLHLGAGLAIPVALLFAVLIWVALPLGLLGAWLMPSRFSGGTIRRKWPGIAVLALAGGLTGFAVSHWERHGRIDWPQLLDDLWRGAALLVPAVLAGAAGMLFLSWGVARVRQQISERHIERERLARERDQAARRAAEAQLKLLQAQIQPHFIFNTLAALQHWVDTGDARAGGLLRTLTAFLRSSTELLGQAEVALGTEADTVRQYLQIMQSRLGERLRFSVQVAPDCAALHLPPGLLLTLVENAVEHGISPALGGGTVQVQAQREGAVVVLRVRDDGAGLAPGWQEGTGLANCRERLRHHGAGRGTLALRALHPGAEAVLTLPGEAA